MESKKNTHGIFNHLIKDVTFKGSERECEKRLNKILPRRDGYTREILMEVIKLDSKLLTTNP